MTQPLILVIEDNEDNAIICRTMLEHSGMGVICSSDGAEGLRLARKVSPDLVILDLSLPRLSGWEVADALRSDPSTARVPILIWSANATRGDRDRAMALGCDGYVSKPCGPLLVLREVQRLLDETANAGADEADPEREGWRARTEPPGGGDRMATASPQLSANT